MFHFQQLIEEKQLSEVTLAHPKAKEWVVTMAKANYQELAKLANEYPELVKLHVSFWIFYFFLWIKLYSIIYYITLR